MKLEIDLFTTTFGAVIFASILACLVTTVGIYIISKFETWGIKNVVYFISFAAGVLISVSFIHIIPKSFGMNDKAPIFLLVGFMGLHFFNRFLNVFICHERDCANLSIGIIPMVGIGLHSLIDGIIYSITFNVSIFTGALAAIGMVLHEFPEGVVTFLLLKQAGFQRKKQPSMLFSRQRYQRQLAHWFPFPLSARLTNPL